MAGKTTVDLGVVVDGPLADGTAKDILHELAGRVQAEDR